MEDHELAGWYSPPAGDSSFLSEIAKQKLIASLAHGQHFAEDADFLAASAGGAFAMRNGVEIGFIRIEIALQSLENRPGLQAQK